MRTARGTHEERMRGACKGAMDRGSGCLKITLNLVPNKRHSDATEAAVVGRPRPIVQRNRDTE